MVQAEFNIKLHSVSNKWSVSDEPLGVWLPARVYRLDHTGLGKRRDESVA